MFNVTHCHNQRPIYEKKQSYLYEWNNPKDVIGKEHSISHFKFHPVVIDIETSAELGQRPILCVVYDQLAKDLIVLYSHGYQEYYLNKEKVEELAKGVNYENIILNNLSQSNFEKLVLRRIHEWNKKAEDRNDQHRKSLVAHNAAFDIPMLGSPNDELLDNKRIGDQYEMAVRYKYVHMLSHRAGQFGQIYQFLDSQNEYQSMFIPVGDTLVASQSLWLPGKLSNACEKIGVEMEVSEAKEHGNLSDNYVKYCINDVWATYKLYNALNDRLENLFGKLTVENLYSTASIGKFILKSMNYRRVGYEQEAIDRIAPSYFGGRTDAEITGEIVEDLHYTDFLSQYPTVSKLTNVWEFMKAEYVSITQIEPKELPNVEDLRDKSAWKDIADYYVKIVPHGATLPVRTPHIEDTTKVVTSEVHSNLELQYHYMDILAAELIDNEKKFDIVAAWKVSKHGKQELQKTSVAGVTISPEDNVMSKMIESRKEMVYNQGFKDSKTLSLKIGANAQYGVSAERIVKEIDGEKQDVASNSGFYNPHVATTITAGGRLLLALGEHVANKYGGNIIYCDTDSMILPDNITDKIVGDFTNLNPYDGYTGTLEVLEKEKFGNLYAVGTKKYVFFDNDGKPLEVKEHGLGNYENLREPEIIERLWATILYYEIEENPLNVDILYDGTLNEPVIWSFTASTRHMRQLVNDLTDDFVRYGDWIQSTLTYDNTTRYIAVNLTDKEDNEKVAKVEIEDSEAFRAEPITYKEAKADDRLKNVRDIVFKFTADAGTPDIRPRVNVNKLKVVTKEATNRQDIFLSKLENQFKENLINISYLEES